MGRPYPIHSRSGASAEGCWIPGRGGGQFFCRGVRDNLETDILACNDGDLFVLECKKVNRPCNFYEIGNTYNATIQAAAQLTLRLALLDDTANRCEPMRTLHMLA